MRYPLIDILRGVAICGMLIFHIHFDIQNFFTYSSAWISIFWEILWKLSAFLFITIAGFSFAYAYKKYSASIVSKYIKYALKLWLIALCISFVTYMLSPEVAVWFGILHFFSIAFLLLLLLKDLYRFNMFLIVLIGCLLYIFPIDSQSKTLFLLWLGEWYSSGDYYPLFPYFWVLLFGYISGQYFLKKNLSHYLELNTSNTISRGFEYIGKHSLFIYIVHQPVILGVLYLLLTPR